MSDWVLEVMFTGLLAFVPHCENSGSCNGKPLDCIDVHVLDASVPCRSKRNKKRTIPPHSAVVLYETGQLKLQWKAGPDGKWLDWPHPTPSFWDPGARRHLSMVSAYDYRLTWPEQPKGQKLAGGLGPAGDGDPGVMSMADLVDPKDPDKATWLEVTSNNPTKVNCGRPEPAAETKLVWGQVYPSSGEKTSTFKEADGGSELKVKGKPEQYVLAEEVTLRMPGLTAADESVVEATPIRNADKLLRWRLVRDPSSTSRKTLVWVKNLPLDATMSLHRGAGHHVADLDTHFEWFYRFTKKGAKRWRVPSTPEMVHSHDTTALRPDFRTLMALIPGEGLKELNPRCPFSQYP